MKTQTIKTSKLAALALTTLASLAFTGCLTTPEESRDDKLAQVAVEILPASVSPTRDLRLKEMMVTLASDAGDTLRDTITDMGSLLSKNPVRLNAADGSRIIHPLYALDPAKAWTVSVKTLDARDSVVHSGSARTGALAAGTFRNVAMPLPARFAAYEAIFALPANMKGATLKRVEAAVDGATACATEASGADSAHLTCDYLPVGNRTVTLSAYGQASSNGATRLLFKGAADLAIAADAPTETLTLGAEDGDAGMRVRLGRVGRVTMNVVTSGALDI